jgi:DNA-binding MarR family transcriptional regulator
MTSVMQLSHDDESALADLVVALRPFQELTLNTKVVATVPLLQLLLMVAMRPHKTVGELAKAAGVANGTVSRQLADLSNVGRSGDPGLCLIERRMNPFDLRYSTNILSPKGAALVKKITAAMVRRQMRDAA